MNVSISVDFGQGYRVSLTPADARALYDRLSALFQTPTLPCSELTDDQWRSFSNSLSSQWSPMRETEPSDDDVTKMAVELESKVKAEMDKQGLTDGELNPSVHDSFERKGSACIEPNCVSCGRSV